MSQEFEAVFENGMLRPLKPIGLRENEVVKVSITQASRDREAELSLGERQRALLLSFVGEMESLPEEGLRDGFSNRDHDQAIYGETE